MSTAVANAEMHALKDRLRATWMAGDYDRFSRFMESSAVEFLDRVGIRVTGVDIAEDSIRAARERAQAEALPAEFDEGDAEALPYADASFDVVRVSSGPSIPNTCRLWRRARQRSQISGDA